MIRLGSQENSQGKSQNQRMGSTTTMLHFREQENQEGIYILLAIRKLAELSKNWSTTYKTGNWGPLFYSRRRKNTIRNTKEWVIVKFFIWYWLHRINFIQVVYETSGGGPEIPAWGTEGPSCQNMCSLSLRRRQKLTGSKYLKKKWSLARGSGCSSMMSAECCPGNSLLMWCLFSAKNN